MSAVPSDVRPAPRRLKAVPPATRPMDLITIGQIKRRLETARLELHTAWLFARAYPEVADAIVAAGQPTRALLDVFREAYERGRL